MRTSLDRLTPFMVMDILQRARQIPGAVHMEVGEPDLSPSPKVIEALQRAVQQRRFYYTPAKGLPELREAIASYYKRNYGVEVPVERILVTPGTSGAFLVVFSLLKELDGMVILADPSYPCYRNFLYLLGLDPLFIPVGPERNYQIMPEDLNRKGVSALVVSSPSNPTGTVYDPEVFKALIEEAERLGIWFVSDEIYHGLQYEGRSETALRFSDRTIVINGFSKYFCMPGLRVGWMILPQEMVRRAEMICQNIFISPNTPAQYAALEAFDEGYLQTVRETFRQRRDFLYGALKEMFPVDARPEGAFYIWASIGEYSNDCLQFAKRLLEKKGVAITPGVDFGTNQTDRYVRFAYTRPLDELEEGVRRIREFLKEGL